VTRIVVTRAQEQSRELAAMLEERGYEVEICPLIEVEALGDDPIDVTAYDWVVLTSANGAAELRRRMIGTPRRVAAIGHATAAAFGGVVDLIPETSTQEGLLAALPRPAGRVLLAAAEGARRLLVDELGAEFLALYRTRELQPASPPVGDLAVVASPSAARALATVAPRMPVVTIGPETTRAATAGGLTVAAEASTQDVAGLVAAVESAAPS
jgi:uroporphyrinogen-III synthase